MPTINGGDILVPQSVNSKLTADVDVAVGDTATKAAVFAARTNYTAFVQKITMSVLTDAAQSLTFQDNASTPVLIAKSKASPGLGPIVWDFGPNGTPLTVSKQLDIVISGAGLVARVHIEGYQRLNAVINIGTSPASS